MVSDGKDLNSGSIRRRRKQNKKNEHIVSRLAREIASDPSISKIASFAVKDEVDHIYGYRKYSLDEISSELEERLYNPTYLGRAISAILASPRANQLQKIHLAEDYLDVVVAYLKGQMPKKTYEYWGGDAEPSYVVESAAYLVSGKKNLDWIAKGEYLKGILSFTNDSTVQAKKSLLEGLVTKINEEYRESRGEGGRNLTDLLSNEDLVIDSYLSLFKEMGSPISLEEAQNDRGKFVLVGNLCSLIDAEGNESSAGALCRLSCLQNDDLTEIFTELPLMPFIRRTPSNRTMLYYDLAKVICQERNVPFSSIVQALTKKLQNELKKTSRVMYYADEPKLKALCRLATEIGESRNGELLNLVQEIIKLKGVETETRLVLFKFLYQNLDNGEEKNSLLLVASNFKSDKIRAWAGGELNAMKTSILESQS